MSLWDRIANLQNIFWHKDGQQIAQPVYNNQGYVNYGLASDIAANIPKYPGTYASANQAGQEVINDSSLNPVWNQNVEKKREATLDFAQQVLQSPAKSIGGAAVVGRFFGPAGMAAGAALGASMYGLGQLDKASGGKVNHALMTATKGVRSNYSFLRANLETNASFGLLTGLAQIGGAIAAGVGTIAAATAAGSVVPGIGNAAGFLAGTAAVLGFYGGGKALRATSETGALGTQFQNSALFAQSVQGQEMYNFGRDATKAAGRISGSKELQNTDTGIGAVVSGLLNIAYEFPTSPDIKGVQLLGKVARVATIGGVSTAKQTMVGGAIQKLVDTPEKIKNRLQADVDLLNRTAAGEKTVYTPMFEFISKNDAATVGLRTEFQLGGEISYMASQLMAGKSYSEIALLFRVGRGDVKAIEELATKHKSTFAQLLRSESKLNQFELKSLPATSSNKYIKKSLQNRKEILEGELKELTGKNADLAKTLRLDSALQERTVSIFPIIEKRKNDIAKQRIANKLGINKTDLTSRETLGGKVTQRIYQGGTFGPVIRAVERWTDDAPHSTINFNDPLQSSTRMRTTIREGVKNGILKQDEVQDLYNKFLGTRFEGEKLKYVEDFTKTIFERIAIKHGIPESQIEYVIKTYFAKVKENRKLAADAKSENRAYMRDPKTGDAVADPVLVSQLANGSYLPDIAVLDKAFAEFARHQNKNHGGIKTAYYVAKHFGDEYNAIWRNLTLFRAGYPQNIMRDNVLRIAADGQYFNVVKEFGKQTFEDFTNRNNSVGKINRWTKIVTDRSYNLKRTSKELDLRIKVLSEVEQSLRNFGYNFNKPPKKIKPEVQRTLDWYNIVKNNVTALEQRKQSLVSNIPNKIVSRKPLMISDYAFVDYRDGVYGKITMQKITGKDDLRGLLTSNNELELAAIRRDREGGHLIKPTRENKDLHLRSWENILVNVLPSDPVAVKIMQGTSKKEILKYMKSIEYRTKLDSFGFMPSLGRSPRSVDVETVYDRIATAVNQFTGKDIALQKLVVEGKVNALTLEKMYPNVEVRPEIVTDMALDLLGQSSGLLKVNSVMKNWVSSLSTWAPAKLAYNPYYAVSYQQKLQSMVAVANAQGIIPSKLNMEAYHANAHSYALKELRGKLNAFSRDSNYPEAMNYLIAFFPAIVEQYKVYGRLISENPEFILKTMQMRSIPSRLNEVQVDPNGQEYVEVTLPFLGDNIKARLSTDWFNPFNPTGGNIFSTSPYVAAVTNQLLKETNIELEEWMQNAILPFGVQKNSLAVLEPTTVRRLGQAWSAWFKGNSEQLNKDTAMIMENKIFEFKQDNDRFVNEKDFAIIQKESGKEAKYMAWIRFLGSGLLPQQPRYVSPLQVYSDKLRMYQENLGGPEGTQKFLEDYPDYFMIVDKLTDATSGIYPDKTSQELVKKNSDIVTEMVIAMGTDKDLRTLGAVFNDENYAFSSSAQAWLQTNTIPGTKDLWTGSQTALENARSSLVNEGWNNWTQLKEVVSGMLLQNNPPYSPTSGYGKSVLDSYKKSFIEKMKTDNQIWWEEKQDRDTNASLKNVVDNLTIAANNEKLWADLSKQARWHSIIDYLNFRFYIKDKLDSRGGISLTSDRAYDIRNEVDDYVLNLRSNDINFGKFYDRYFDNDDFKYVRE